MMKGPVAGEVGTGGTDGGASSAADSLNRKHSWAVPLPLPSRPGVKVLVWGRNDLGQLGLAAGQQQQQQQVLPPAVYVPTVVEVSGRARLLWLRLSSSRHAMAGACLGRMHGWNTHVSFSNTHTHTHGLVSPRLRSR